MKLIIKFVIIISAVLLASGCSKGADHSLELTFKQAEMKPEITKISEQDIDGITSEIKVNDAIVFLYEPITNTEQINGGIKIKDDYYDVGVVSVFESGNQIEPENLFGKKVVKLSGSLGANYGQAIYISIEDSRPSILLQVDGNTVEDDIDGDNENEIVSTWGTLSNTKIYKSIGNKIMFSDVNESVKAQVVIYRNDSKSFEIYFKPNEPKYFIFLDEKLNEVKR